MLGLVVLGGWALHSTFFIQISPDLAPMQRNTAMCFALTGLALLGVVAGLPGRTIFLSTISAVFAGGSLLEYLFSAGHFVGVATHDEWLISHAEELVARLGLTNQHYEFQMLLGVKPALRRKLIADGHQLRVYVPYGADWYPYSLRRLRENPQVAVHVLRAMLTGK